MRCVRCQAEIEADSRFCRHCGAAQAGGGGGEAVAGPASPVAGAASGDGVARNNGLPVWAIVAIVVVGVIVLASVFSAPTASDRASTDYAAAPADADAADVAAAASEAASAAAEASADDGDGTGGGWTPANWSYATDEDKVRGGTTYYASTTSTNSIAQDFPYSSATRMELTVRKSPAFGTDVIFTVSSGQLMCRSYDGCSGTVSFDGGPAQTVRFLAAGDNSSDTIFVSGAKVFIGKLKGAKHMVLEKTLYRAGNPQFEFDVEGLEWDH